MSVSEHLAPCFHQVLFLFVPFKQCLYVHKNKENSFFFFFYFYFPSFCCRQVFPNGLPEEYSLVATFRVRRNTKKERWYIWQILNQHDTPEVRVVFVFVFF